MPSVVFADSRVREARAAPRRFTIPATVEQVLSVAAAYWMLGANQLFFRAALADRAPADLSTWGFALALAALLVAAHVFLLALVANRWTLKPLLAVLIVATALATYFMQRYGLYLDPAMLRNVLRTNVGEARELLSWALLPHLLVHAGLPLALLWRVQVVRRRWPRALLARLLVLLLAAATASAALLAVFQPFASLMRNHTQVRYLITPANYLWSIASVAAADAHSAHVPRQPVGLDAAPGPSWAGQARPRLVVLVVGETARAADWGLNGQSRQTTPRLAHEPVVNFADVRACGTSTEVSLPCMFSAVGRRDYDERRIRGSESLLQVAARAGVAVLWRDNQSGCKGVCEGLSSETVSPADAPGLCPEGRCFDEALLAGLDQRLARARGTQLLVLHMLGSHGPSYFRRYPPAFAQFQPACEDDDLTHCTGAQIVNAYDNSVRYTDHVLASLIAKLQARAGQVDSALVYVSDHGESLGENGLFLHGMPYPIAPDVQTRVPLVMWFSPGMQAGLGVDRACLQRRATQPASHDNLFHTVLGLLDVRTTAYEGALDLLHGCRSPALQAAAR